MQKDKKETKQEGQPKEPSPAAAVDKDKYAGDTEDHQIASDQAKWYEEDLDRDISEQFGQGGDDHVG